MYLFIDKIGKGGVLVEIKKAKLVSNSIRTVNPNPHYKEVVRDGITYVETYGYNGPKSEYTTYLNFNNLNN